MVVRRFGGSDDAVAVTRLLHRAYSRLGEMGLNYTAVDQDVATTVRRMGEGVGFVALEGETVVGTVVVCPPGHEEIHPWLARADACHLCQFAVEPGLQGRGIGRALAEACEQQGREWGCGWIVLDTAVDASHLIEMYAGWGYGQVGDFQWPGKSYRSVVMAKALGTLRG